MYLFLFVRGKIIRFDLWTRTYFLVNNISSEGQNTNFAQISVVLDWETREVNRKNGKFRIFSFKQKSMLCSNISEILP